MKKVLGIISVIAAVLFSGWVLGSKAKVIDTADEFYSPNTGTTPVIVFVAIGIIAIAVIIFIRRRK
ncbi:MAG: LPXTG cell wall anchor domain-containing protein [Oscillospiraceae bacterium]|nr:LPXTG cell wall anchor domain-containing protein [Oscillospiraceae bacterium]